MELCKPLHPPEGTPMNVKQIAATAVIAAITALVLGRAGVLHK